ncbi:YceI family protein [bacterium]|nr:YceI family protein [bacterium]
MKKIAFVLALTFISYLSIGIGWTPETALVKFYIKNAGVEVTGTLSGLAASVEFDPEDLSNSTITASVDVKTINTGIEMRDNHLRSADYFDASKYPKISMESQSFRKSGSSFIGTFKLTMHGVSKVVDVPFTFDQNGDDGKFNGTFELDRLDYGVGESSWVLSDDVKVKILLNVNKKSS